MPKRRSHSRDQFGGQLKLILQVREQHEVVSRALTLGESDAAAGAAASAASSGSSRTGVDTHDRAGYCADGLPDERA